MIFKLLTKVKLHIQNVQYISPKDIFIIPVNISFFGLCFAHVFFLLLFEIFGLDLIHFKGEEVAWAWWGLRWLRAAGPPARGGPKTGWSPLGRSRRAQQAGSRRFWIQIVSLKLFRIIFCPRCCNFLEYFYFKMMCIKACFFAFLGYFWIFICSPFGVILFLKPFF